MRPSRHRVWPGRTRGFALLMAGALLAALLPVECTRWPRSVVQPLIGLQSAAGHATRTVAPDRPGGAPPTREEFQRLREWEQQLRRLVGQQDLLLEELRRQVQALSGIRDQLGESSLRIIFAPVVGVDTSPSRAALILGKGGLHGVTAGQWVAAGRAAEQRPSGQVRELLLSEWLIGRVCEVQPYEARVQLASDPQFGPLTVTVVRELADGRWQSRAGEFLLRGAGGQRMRIEEADADLLAEGYRIVVARLPAALPVSMALGTIQQCRPVPTSPLHFDLEIEPIGAPQRLSHVYVIATQP